MIIVTLIDLAWVCVIAFYCLKKHIFLDIPRYLKENMLNIIQRETSLFYYLLIVKT